MVEALGAKRSKFPATDNLNGEKIVSVKSVQPLFSNPHKNVYVDIVDYFPFVQFLIQKSIKDCPIVAMTKSGKEFLSNYVSNQIVVLPQQHCNFENSVREDREVRVVGHVGTRCAFHLDASKLQSMLEDIDLEFRFMDVTDGNVTREEVCEFYKQIDIQVCFRPDCITCHYSVPQIKDTLKLKNAGSFRIPTVAYPETVYIKEAPECFMTVDCVEGVVESCKALKEDKTIYDMFADRALAYSSNFHISKVAEVYKKELGDN